jgi:hypothetical protein
VPGDLVRWIIEVGDCRIFVTDLEHIGTDTGNFPGLSIVPLVRHIGEPLGIQTDPLAVQPKAIPLIIQEVAFKCELLGPTQTGPSSTVGRVSIQSRKSNAHVIAGLGSQATFDERLHGLVRSKRFIAALLIQDALSIVPEGSILGD